MAYRTVILLSVLSFNFLSCKNQNVSKDVERYCKCLEKHQNDVSGRDTCIEMMIEIKEKYDGDDRALMQILEDTDSCL